MPELQVTLRGLVWCSSRTEPQVAITRTFDNKGFQKVSAFLSAIAVINFVFRNDIVCELVGAITSQEPSNRTMAGNCIVGGLGKFVYTIFADPANVVKLTCDKKDPSRHVNHSCKPNATFVEVRNWKLHFTFITPFLFQLYYCGYLVVVIRALQDIARGAEVTVDYGKNFGVDGQMKCLEASCGKVIGCFADRVTVSRALQAYQRAVKHLKDMESSLTVKDKASVNLNIDSEVERVEKLLGTFRDQEILDSENCVDHDSLPCPPEVLVSWPSIRYPSAEVQTDPFVVGATSGVETDR